MGFIVFRVWLVADGQDNGTKKVFARRSLGACKYTRQPEKLRAWQSASHVERAPEREKKTPLRAFAIVPTDMPSVAPAYSQASRASAERRSEPDSVATRLWWPQWHRS